MVAARTSKVSEELYVKYREAEFESSVQLEYILKVFSFYHEDLKR